MQAHAHDRRGPSHGVSADADRRYLAIALVLIVGFMAAEVVTGIVAHSLALLSDAGHMLTDAAAIAFSLIAISLARRPAKGALSAAPRERIESLHGGGLVTSCVTRATELIR